MIKRHAWISMLLALLLSACAATPTQQTGAPGATPKQLRDGQIIVTLAWDTPEVWARLTAELQRDYGLTQVGDFPLDSIRVQCVVFSVPSDQLLPMVVARLASDPRVESVQSNQVFDGLRASHNDPYGALAYGALAVRADRAHRVSTGKGVRVVVVDTGVDRDHPDLRGRLAKIANFVEGGERSFARDRHGTAVAGVIGARANDGVGIFGVAPETDMSAAKACWYPDEKAGKALCSSWTLAKAIDFAIVSKVHVINMSLSGPADALLQRLLFTAHAQGITLVAAVAEGGDAPGFPASLEEVIAVLPSDSKGNIAPVAWRKANALAAPGVDILTTAPREGYDYLSGSSLAAAHVSGVVALLLQAHPQLAPAEVARIMLASARGAGGAVGVIDACAALSQVEGSRLQC